MVKIRLRRMGARNRPYYRIVVSDSRLTARAVVFFKLRLPPQPWQLSHH